MTRPYLTPRQRECLDTIQAAIRCRQCPPTIREIMRAMGITSPNGVMFHLNQLEKKRYIERDRTARGIRVVVEDGACPLCGRVR